MTALNYLLTPEGIALSMDTLVIDSKDKIPIKMVTKFIVIPNINCIICGTGNFNAIVDWFAWVQKNIICVGIYQLNKLTAQVLPDFMKKYNGNNVCTIYQFGLDEIDKKFHGYVYRSTDKFISEEIQYGLSVKPYDAFSVTDGMLNIEEHISYDDGIEEIFYKLMQIQKEYDYSLEVNERVGIGGMVEVVILKKDYISIRNYKYFDDYEDTYKKMILNFNKRA